MPTPPPASDLTAQSTLALALFTAALAFAAFYQAYLSRKSIQRTESQAERGFGFEELRQMQTMTPIVIAEASSKKPTFYRYLSLRNVGQGPAVNVRFSGTLNEAEFTAAQYGIAAIASTSIVQTPLQLHKNFESRWPVYELLIRYEDLFGNTYSTEYAQFDEGSEWYVWKRPWLGKNLGVARPVHCADDEAAWGPTRSEVL